ncbi:AraC family transcriptional regulator [Aureimonas altamirensis]|uniref:AraC family transcriptional regulator n=1 Tax=Aureimonas altamirensis TaxID=370622 RepID=UPI001E38ADA8|nr:AraC family transcriptional regulator [Aureimonas altamirensis]UHD45801.1 AraC family transcriptional regulator [Aureimonas altamirensis]
MSDPFSSTLSLLGTRGVRGTSLEASGEWALSFDGRARLKFVAVTRGHCWLLLPCHPPEEAVEGDVLLLSDTRYVVASDPAVEPEDGMELYAAPGHDTVRIGDGIGTVLVGGGTAFAEGCAAYVLDVLPSFLRIDAASAEAGSVARTLVALQEEVRRDAMGSSLIAERLAEILIVEAVRAYVAAGPADRVGWITALADPRIAKAIGLMHRDAARRWTVPILAREVGMSRSNFTRRFTERVGRPSSDYLTRWRMIMAQRMLQAGHPVSTVATEVGYSSQGAFAQAFKRTLGCTPTSGRLGSEAFAEALGAEETSAYNKA